MSYRGEGAHGTRRKHPVPPVGFFCPKCPPDPHEGHVALQVDTTNPAASGIVVRYRYCPKCGYSITTEERRRPRSPAVKVKA
ncbi:MAG TPA: hypothetical protein VEA69_21130 [Tepidisphaeraceae bacterium]|nr:hypothetical protein [Tepidisphaeraceae bacterium]